MFASTTDVLVNATTIGMESTQRGIPIKDEDLKEGMTILDLVYNPYETELLRKAKRSGCKTISGIEMLLHQGAAAFELWTGMRAPLDIMRHALSPAIGEKS